MGDERKSTPARRWIETTPLGDPFGSKVHRPTCPSVVRAVNRQFIDLDRARKLEPCMRCKPTLSDLPGSG